MVETDAEQMPGRGLYVHQCHVNFKSPGRGGFAFHAFADPKG
jgi:ectoine hydroxylase